MLDVIGHTDGKGTDEYNLTLSEKRSKSVVNYLMAIHGIEEDRLVPSGKGMREPIASNDTEEGRYKNRRVELKKRN